MSKPALAASPKSVDLPPMEPQPDGEKVHTLAPSTPLPQAMARLLHMGVAALPVVDNNGMLLDLYARADVVRLTFSTPHPCHRRRVLVKGNSKGLMVPSAQVGLLLVSLLLRVMKSSLELV